jgi:ketosteroid isomerase-like protein
MRPAARRSLLALVLALAVPLSTLAAQSPNAAPRASAAAAHGPRERAVLDAMEEFHRALIARDLKALDERVFAADYTFINDKGAIVSRAERLANLASQSTQVAAIDNVREITVRIYGDNAVVQNRLTLRGQYSGQPTNTDARVGYVFISRAGRWQLVTNQVTPVRP